MIIVVDTNVIVSAIIKPFSESAQILNLILSGKLKLVYDSRIIIEHEEVLKRDKFSFDSKHIDSIITQIKEEGVPIDPLPVNENIPDRDDIVFLEVAISSNANFIVTGNKKHFPKSKYRNLKVVSPAEFLDEYRKIIFK